MFFKKLVTTNAAQRQQDRDAELYRALLRREAKIGGEIFGSTEPGIRREFFCLDARTWIWHEEWTDQAGKQQIRTTRYDVRPDGILKAQDGQGYQRVGYDEAHRLMQATNLYQQRVLREVYGTEI
jgi:hypothetical protein